MHVNELEILFIFTRTNMQVRGYLVKSNTGIYVVGKFRGWEICGSIRKIRGTLIEYSRQSREDSRQINMLVEGFQSKGYLSYCSFVSLVPKHPGHCGLVKSLS